ncbi:P-loop containing nucleoside triphosphate hydrolase protein [Xylogone sp. PMI_703]|nr:P-loop containing nucleoside triphosphate hydrolase protein [Xylogone sp. PMI_703]
MSLDTLYQYIYPLQPQQRTRTKPMKVLALGLPRTATDSLRVALTKLGYEHVYHGFDHIANARDCVNWVHLWSLKTSGQRISRSDFDLVLGHCEAVTDMPACIFAEELMDAYPEAKIIINYRDVESWHRSVVNVWSTAEKQAGWMHPLLVWFHPEMFWVNVNEQRMTYGGLFRDDYRKNGRAAFQDHYAMLGEATKGMGKDRVLRWKAQDGWSPLCEFLGKEVPDEEFPNRNALDQVVQKVIESLMKDADKAFRNMVLFSGFVVAGIATLTWRYY